VTGRKNAAASVRQRLLNRARNEQRPFAELLQYYSMERFLYRLSRSTHAQSFILKGALMLRVWQAPECRPTMDIDMLGRTSSDQATIVSQIKEILNVQVDPDGLNFDQGSILAEHIKYRAEGVKLEQQIPITEPGNKLMSKFPFETDLLT
jgi:hypothetical protein